MATYKKNGARQFKIEKQKDAMNQLRNFANIMESMKKLNTFIEEFPGHITEDNITEVAKDINKSKHLKLSDKQVEIVVNKFINPTPVSNMHLQKVNGETRD